MHSVFSLERFADHVAIPHISWAIATRASHAKPSCATALGAMASRAAAVRIFGHPASAPERLRIENDILLESTITDLVRLDARRRAPSKSAQLPRPAAVSSSQQLSFQ
jgi:hypothetical protein